MRLKRLKPTDTPWKSWALKDLSEPEFQEVDNCPRCGAQVVLEHGTLEGAYEITLDIGPTEIEYGVCKICGTKFRRREVLDKRKRRLVVVYEEWDCLIPELSFKFMKLGPFICKWWKLKEKSIPVAHF